MSLIIHTTKKIIEDTKDKEDLIFNLPQSRVKELSEKYEEELNEEWVCLVDLKKQIPAVLDNAVNRFMIDYPKARTIEASNLHDYIREELKELCNSSEQKERIMMDSEHSSAGSVSGEHNTGEESTNVKASHLCNTRSNIGKSSPVQNPNERYSDSFSRVKASGQESVKNSPANIQKKCTCKPEELSRYDEAERISEDEYRCSRCGGAL